MTGALSAAATIAASIRGDCTESEAAAWHSQRVAISYTRYAPSALFNCGMNRTDSGGILFFSWSRFLVVVLSAYKQIRAQSANVLVDIDEGNFDKAFAFFRPGTFSLLLFLNFNPFLFLRFPILFRFYSPLPSVFVFLFLPYHSRRLRLLRFPASSPSTPVAHFVPLQTFLRFPFALRQPYNVHMLTYMPATVIQGGAEMGARLSEDEVQRALDFCVHLFSPTTPEQHDAVRLQLEATLPEDAHEHEDSLGYQHEHERSQMTSDDGLRSPPIVDSVQDDTAAMAYTRTPSGQSMAERLLDVRAPLVDPAALGRLLRAKLPGLFHRRSSNASITSVASSVSAASVGSARSAVSGETVYTSPAVSGPGSPVSERFFVPPPLGGDCRRGKGGIRGGGDDEGGDAEVQMVLDKVNARRVIHAEHAGGLNSLEQEAVYGFVLRLVQGKLGLARAETREERASRIS
jgi:hypothetical protein